MKDQNCNALHVELLSYTPDPANLIGLAGRMCYSDAGIEGIKEKINREEQNGFIEKIIKLGSKSILDHINFTFAVEGISKRLSRQLATYKLTSLSQKPEKYIKADNGFKYIIPESLANKPEKLTLFTELMQDISDLFVKLVKKGVSEEDACYILPDACETKLILTMSAGELIPFFEVNCCNNAPWEIKSLADLMIQECIKTVPAIFKFTGPGCLFGPCPEGDETCGDEEEMRRKYHELLITSDRLN